MVHCYPFVIKHSDNVESSFTSDAEVHGVGSTSVNKAALALKAVL